MRYRTSELSTPTKQTKSVHSYDTAACVADERMVYGRAFPTKDNSVVSFRGKYVMSMVESDVSCYMKAGGYWFMPVHKSDV